MDSSPKQAICTAGVPKIRDLYEKQCCPFRLTVGQEFRQFFKASNLPSQERFGDLVGLSRGQVHGILHCNRLPSADQLEAARGKARRLFGEPDKREIARVKRQKAISCLLPALGLRTASAHDSGFAAHKVEHLSCSLTIPDHASLSTSLLYDEWLHEQLRRDNSLTFDDVNAAGHFLAVREYLAGFEDRLFEDALDLATSRTNDELGVAAKEVYRAMRGITMALDSFRSHEGELAKVRRDLSNGFDSTTVPQCANDELVIAEFLRPWGLAIADFSDPNSTTGFLVMHSDSLRQHANSVLLHSTESH